MSSHGTDSTHLNVLIIEDSESDTALLEYELRAKGYELNTLRVETSSALRAALERDWHVILSDFRMPQFNAITALEILRNSGKDIPFILVSQAVGEGAAVELMRAGASDYIMKSSLRRLGPAVEREVREAALRAEARRAAQALADSEKRLREREAFLESIITSQINGIVVVNSEGEITIANASAARILELKQDEITGRYYQQADYWKQIDQNFEPIPSEQLPLSIALTQGRSVSGFEHGLVFPDGNIKWLSVSCSPIRDTENRVTGAVASFLEITEVYMQRERNLQQLQRLRLQDEAINSSLSGVIISDARMPDMPVTYINRAFTAITGYTAEDIIGRNCRFLHRDDSDQPDLHRLRTALQNREGGEFTLRNYRKDGKMFVSNLRIAPVRNEAGETTHFVAIQTDITEKYEAERKIAEAGERLAQALKGGDLGLWDWNITSGEAFFDERWCGMLGYTSDQVAPCYESFSNLIHPDDLPAVREQLEMCFRDPKMQYEAEFRMRHSSGRWIWILSRGKIVEWGADSTPFRMVGTHADITLRKQQEAKILELSHRLIEISEMERAEISSELHDVLGQNLVLTKLNLQKFLGDHQLRTPENEKLLLEPIADTLKKAREISRRLTPSHMKKVGLVLALEDMLQSAAALSNVQIETDIGALEGFFPDNWSIACYRVVQESVTNALKHSGASKITVRARRVDTNLELTIADNGGGFADAAAADGIGLALMRERIRSLRGHLFVESSANGLIITALIPGQEAADRPYAALPPRED